MDAQKLLARYTEIKKIMEKSTLSINDMFLYLSGWLDCAKFVIKGENND